MNYYLDIDFYVNEYNGKPNTEFNKNLYLAQEKIDEVTHNRIVTKGFDNLTPFQKNKIKMALCFQIDYINENGIDDLNDVSNYSVLDISLTVNETDKREAKRLNMSSIAYSLLKKTGLTNRSFRWH